MKLVNRGADPPPLLCGDRISENDMRSFELNGKTAVVLGGTEGIGRSVAIALARAGADVVASSRSIEKVDAIASEIEALGRKTLRGVSDVKDRQSLITLHSSIIGELGKVDILVNSAGITQRIPTLECPEEVWTHIMDTNLSGTLRACQVFGRGMLERKFGRIINIASLATFVAFHEVAAYGASKAAVGALTRSLAVEWAPQNVTVNAIAPGIIPTELNRKILGSDRGKELLLRTPSRRFGLPEEVAGAAVFLAQEQSSFVTGQILTVDGGFLASGVNQ